MEVKIVSCIIICFFVIACKQTEEKQKAKLHQHEACSCDHCSAGNVQKALADLTMDELHELNIELSKKVRNDFRSWNFNEPERWEYLSQKFVDEVVGINPDLPLDKQTIAEIFVTYLKQRSDVYFSDSKNKKVLAGKASSEFKYNLSYEIGIEGYNKWQKVTLAKFEEYRQLKDSLKNILIAQNQNNNNPNKSKK